MSMFRLQGWAVMFLAVGLLMACSGRKQVPFGLEDAGAGTLETVSEPVEGTANGERAALPVGVTFGPDQVEVPVADSTLVLRAGYALAALELDLDGNEAVDAIVVSAAPRQVWLQAAYPRGLDVAARQIDSFLVPEHCTEPKAEVRRLSASLIGVRVEHECELGARTNVLLLTIEAQPRARERITVLPPNEASTAPIELELRVEDRDADGYDDVVAEVEIGRTHVPLAWLDRPGGFARDVSQPEATLAELADSAWHSLRVNPDEANDKALAVLDAFRALCRESGSARVGLSGTQGLQCQQSPATARAVSVAMTSAIRRGQFVRALELQRWWDETGIVPSPEQRELVLSAWRAANAKKATAWRLVDTEAGRASLFFRDESTLIVDARAPRAIDLGTGSKTRLPQSEVVPPARDPEARYAVRGVRATCAGFEAEVGPIAGKQTHRVPIERRSSVAPCRTPIDRAASVYEWAVLGWAPQGLVAGSGDLLRIIPLNAFAKQAGRPIDLSAGSPLPAPIRGARIIVDGSRYVIPHSEGVVIRDWREGGTGLWLRPRDWNDVPGQLRGIAISPSGRQVAVQKGSEIRVLTW